ncbi:MAG: CBS and ACT domain-containing protein [Deferrisomatales bacterium]
MLVRKWMSPDPLTVQADTPVAKAASLMREHTIRHLPVLDGDRLVGVVTDRDLKEFSPSKATSLEVHELHHLLLQAKASEAMTKEPLHVAPGDSIEHAARLMHDHKVGCLPVVGEDGRVVGILTQEDVFEALVVVTGARSDTVRLQMTISDEPGSIKVVADKVRAQGLKLRSILTTYQGVPEGQRELILRVEGDTSALEGELQGGYPDLLVHRGC